MPSGFPSPLTASPRQTTGPSIQLSDTATQQSTLDPPDRPHFSFSPVPSPLTASPHRILPSPAPDRQYNSPKQPRNSQHPIRSINLTSLPLPCPPPPSQPHLVGSSHLQRRTTGTTPPHGHAVVSTRSARSTSLLFLSHALPPSWPHLVGSSHLWCRTVGIVPPQTHTAMQHSIRPIDSLLFLSHALPPTHGLTSSAPPISSTGPPVQHPLQHPICSTPSLALSCAHRHTPVPFPLPSRPHLPSPVPAATTSSSKMRPHCRPHPQSSHPRGSDQVEVSGNCRLSYTNHTQ